MDFFEASLARLHPLRFPSDLSFTRDGTVVAAAHEPRQSPQSRVWRFSLDGAEAALPERGVESELVVYPREGHGLRERDHQLEHFPAKWTPVCVEKMRQNKELEPRSDSIGTEKALDAWRRTIGWFDRSLGLAR